MVTVPERVLRAGFAPRAKGVAMVRVPMPPLVRETVPEPLLRRPEKVLVRL
jgi:hypothetical protein